MVASKSVKLNTGAEFPTVSLGTWKSQPGQVEKAVEHALKSGYKGIDTAAAYSNEAEVGEGLKASGVPRSEYFLTTKLDNNCHKDPAAALEDSLKKLGTDYLDLWLMHWPAPMNQELSEADKSHDWIDTWKAMSKLYKENPNKLKAIGVSNVSIKFMERLLAEGGDVVPAVNQVELHPSCYQKELLDFCKSKGIVVTSYSPLGSDNSPLLTNPIVTKLAEKYSVQPANILISLQANTPNVTVLPKSVTPARIEANQKIVDLTQEEVDELNSIDKTAHFRACDPNWTKWGSLGFPDCEK